MRVSAFGILLAAAWAMPAAGQDGGGDPFEAYDAGRYVEAEMAAEDALSRDPENPVWWALAAESRAKLRQHHGAAGAFSRAAEFERDLGKRSYFLRAQAMQLVYARMLDEARTVVRTAMADRSLYSLDWAMVAIAAGDDRTAQEILSDEAFYPNFTRQSALDAAYSAKRRGLDARASRFFGIGLALGEEEGIEPVRREGIRREIRELQRDWSILAQASYSTAGTAFGLGSVPLGEDRAMQFGAEVSHRIGGWRNGRPFSLFGRVFHSEYFGSDVLADNATQGWLGLRYKPLSGLNLNLEASRLVGLDRQGIDDWSLRAAVSAGEGYETETGRSSWTYLHAYSDIAYMAGNDVAYGLAEGRVGQAFAVTRSAQLTPYAIARAGLDTGRAEEAALGAGAGITLRVWFDETETAAPRGFIDFDLQARERIAGDDSASGVLASITIGR